jgi:hypothetical protein
MMKLQSAVFTASLILETNATGLGRRQDTPESLQPPCTDDSIPGVDGKCTKLASSSNIKDMWGSGGIPTRHHIFGTFMTTEASHSMTSTTTTATMTTADTGVGPVSSTMDSGARRNLGMF